jgi:hypothetical protein
MFKNRIPNPGDINSEQNPERSVATKASSGVCCRPGKKVLKLNNSQHKL